MSGFTVDLGTPANQYNGTYQAVVSSIADPLDLGRIQMFIPQVLGNVNSNWASPAVSGMNAPVVGEQVLAMFLGGNINTPMFMTSTEIPGVPTTFEDLTVTGDLTANSSSITTLTVTGDTSVQALTSTSETTSEIDLENEAAPSAPTGTTTGTVGAKVWANAGILYGEGTTGGAVQLAPPSSASGSGFVYVTPDSGGTGQSVSSSVTLTGFSGSSVAATTYLMRGYFLMIYTSGSGTITLGFTGPSTNFALYGGNGLSHTGSVLTPFHDHQPASGTGVGSLTSFTLGAAYSFDNDAFITYQFSGYVSFSGSSAFSVQAASAGTVLFYAGCFLSMQPVSEI